MKTKVIIRADGNSNIGLGHTIRCLALADMLKQDFNCILATRYLTGYIQAEANKAGIDIIKLPQSEEHFEVFLSILSGDEIVVLDNYFFSSEYQSSIKEKGCKLVCIDDIHHEHFVADVVINHAGGIDRKLYSTALYTFLYTGPDYVLLRPEFLSYKGKKGKSMLVSMGGADPKNDTLKVLRLLEEKKIPGLCYVIVGDAFLYQSELEGFCRHSGLNLEVKKNLSAKEMADIMLDCQYAICPPSTVSYEYLSLSGGELYVNVIADNQCDMYRFFLENKIAFDVRDLFITDKTAISDSLRSQRTFFDGQSKSRILSIFHSLRRERETHLRAAIMDDIDLYYQWANDPEARKNAFLSSDDIPYKDHCKWFNDKLISHNTYLWVLERKGIPLGHIRFDIDRESKYATISYFIDKRYRNSGWGLSIVKLGLEKLGRLEDNITVDAIVKRTNIGSIRIFERLNFMKTDHSGHTDFIKYIK
ncbi:MAG: UDP-2,4-diacetamido-2,4,6-trideoxy-beta-L-altropyranose hydrolase [Bacteroidales bacterium]|jgi:UDP-2,4-diacetamido-2,4,6-trideoxy-beta-L-altropyranose hydrolase|nr:UDP-2,4-diacetamido-2,4,6-trideoxy-beta-L-altropyranose hydrolase [Bacteroidales bacterium]